MVLTGFLARLRGGDEWESSASHFPRPASRVYLGASTRSMTDASAVSALTPSSSSSGATTTR